MGKIGATIDESSRSGSKNSNHREARTHIRSSHYLCTRQLSGEQYKKMLFNIKKIIKVIKIKIKKIKLINLTLRALFIE